MATIDEVIESSYDFAGELLEEARDLVSDANNIAQGRSYANVLPLEWVPTEVNEDDSFISDGYPSSFNDSITLPPSDDIPGIEFQPAYLLQSLEFPYPPTPLNTTGLFSQDAPDWNLADFTTAAPSVNTNVAYPTAPAIALPDTPVSSDDIFDVPDIVTPTFDDSLNAVAVSTIDVTGRIDSEFTITREQLLSAAESHAANWLNTYDPNYSANLATLEARIEEAIAGGSAMNEAWEQAIYDRALIRTTDEQHRAQAALSEDYARRGFALPPGAVMAGLSRMRFESSRNTADISANIANERARIELQHMQFGMQISATLRQHFSSAMQSYMQLVYQANGQALQYAFEIGRWAAELFNQGVELYRLELARYQAEADVYRVRLESAFAIIKVFEVEIQAEQLKIAVDQNNIALYEAKIKGEMSKIDIYNSQLTAIKIRLEAEAQKIQVYESQVRAYAARVGAKESEYNAYRAAIQGDLGKVEGYQAEVSAYKAQVDAVGTRVSAERDVAQSVNDFNRALIDQQDSAIRKYLAELQIEETRYGGSIEAYKTALAAYSTQVDATLRLRINKYEKDRLNLSAEIARVETNLRAQLGNVESAVRSIVAQAQITQNGASIIGDMGASVLSTNNTLLTKDDT